MPELPEVETTVLGLRKKVLSRTFVDVWTDFKKLVKEPSFKKFKKEIRGKEIKSVYRRGKNIILVLSSGYYLLVHQKMTGHLLYGRWEKKDKWVSLKKGPMEDKYNSYIHLIFFLDKGMLALSDLRKFAKVKLLKEEELEKELEDIGPDALEISFEEFKNIIKEKKGKIKQVLMDQKLIAGIGNIYSDEALFRAGINPFKKASSLKEKELISLYKNIIDVLKKGVKKGGESISDYRNLEGEKGKFDDFRKVYRRKGEKCPQCGEEIKRKKIGSRSTHFCPKCQKL